MALTNNLGSSGEAIIRKRLFGKFNTLGFAQGFNTQLQKEDRDVKFLPLTMPSLFPDNLAFHVIDQSSNWANYVVLTHNNTVKYVVVPRFLDQMRKMKVLYSPTVPHDMREIVQDEYTSSEFYFAVNGNQPYPGFAWNFPPITIKMQGFVYSGGNQVLTSVSEPTPTDANLEMMSFQHYETVMPLAAHLEFLWAQDPNRGEGLGGLTPVIYKGASFGAADENGSSIRNDHYNSNLKHYNESGNPRTLAGKHVLAYRSDHLGGSVLDDCLMIIITEDNAVGPGMDIDEIRDFLYNLDFEHAGGLDGSDSVFLFEGPNKWHVTAGYDKNISQRVSYVVKS